MVGNGKIKCKDCCHWRWRFKYCILHGEEFEEDHECEKKEIMLKEISIKDNVNKKEN
jgi:hypothetical protein